MTDSLVHAAVDFAAGVLRDAAAEPVTYVRGSGQAALMASLAAVRAPREYASLDAPEAAIGIRMDDWLILAEDLVLDGAATEPQAGDRIIDARGRSYEALPMPARNVWEWSGNGRYRIHAKLVQRATGGEATT